MNNVNIIGVGTFLPGPKIDNRMISETFSVKEEWIDLFIGTKTRHLAMDLHTKKPRYKLVDLCEKAAKEALLSAKKSAESIEFIVMATATPDDLMPATVNQVADRLGINGVATYALQSGCAGAIQALDVASQFIKSGTYKTGLVIGGDVCNKYLDMTQNFEGLPSSELINYVLFGDGAGSVVLTSEEADNAINIAITKNTFEGLSREPGQQIGWIGKTDGGMDEDMTLLKEDYKAIQNNVPEMAKETFESLLESTGWSFEDIDHYMPPQLSGHMTDHIIDHMALRPEKAINCVADTGNNGNALPFLQLQLLWHKMVTGEKCIGVAIESSKWIKTGIALTR